jgi:hypothetical protein
VGESDSFVRKQPAAEAPVADLYWHCEVCGEHETAQPEYAHGDHEPCTCGKGTARVMTLQDAAKLESEIARGIRVPKEAYSD